MLPEELAGWLARRVAAQDTPADSDKKVAKRFRAAASEWLLAADSIPKAATDLHLAASSSRRQLRLLSSLEHGLAPPSAQIRAVMGGRLYGFPKATSTQIAWC